MNLAVVGCGYVAEFYAKTLSNYPSLRIVSAYDLKDRNLDAFVRLAGCRKMESLEAILSDAGVDLVINLTNPRSHFEVTRRSLEAGKHVYSEKPLGMTTAEATQLADLADQRGLYLSSAPCSLLSETAQTLWHAIRSGAIGKVRLVYANFDDGMIAPRLEPWAWLNQGGVPWPAKDEFEVGCTFEHAGYLLTWLGAFFGPATSITSFASCQLPDKGIPVDVMAPDFSVGCIEYGDGVVARLTCGIVGPRDKSLTIIGDDGTLFVGHVRHDAGPVFLRRAERTPWHARFAHRLAWLDRFIEARTTATVTATLFQRQYSLGRRPPDLFVSRRKPVDFMRGPAEMAQAIQEGRPCRLSARFGVHLVESVERLQYPGRFGSPALDTSFSPIEPLDWAR
jgi:predicted dehydrogenase